MPCEPLREPRIRPTARRVFFIGTGNPNKPFDTFGNPSEADKRAVVEIIRRIRTGQPLDEYYRAGIDDTPDELLERHGVLHLHLAARNSKHLLYLVQYENPDGDYVVILEVNDHKHFRRPVGGLLTRYALRLRRLKPSENR